MTGLSRRSVLRALGWGAAGITAMATGACGLPVLPPRNDPTADDAAGWVSLRPEGHFEISSPRAEMGQGIASGLRLLAAEELGVALAQVRLVNPDTGRLPVCRATVGSDSMRVYGPLMAQAAAGLALVLRRRAAMRLDVPIADVRLGPDGASAAGAPTVAWADLADGPVTLVSDKDVAAARPRSLAADTSHRVVGTPHPTDGIQAIVTGNGPLYADDIRLPGMLFGAVLRSEGIDGTLSRIDDSACRAVPGYVGLVRGDGFAGVLAERRGALAQALSALQMSDSHDDGITSATIAEAIDIDAGLSDGALEHVLANDGDAHSGAFDIDLRLDVPMAAHASIEPRTVVARFDDQGRLEVWTGTQDAFFVRKTLADALALSSEDVLVHGMRIGGGFGARTLVLAELDAARLARLSGRPVKVQWSRRDEFRAGFHRQPSSHRIRASADSEGRITRWWHAFRAGHVIFTSAAMGPTLQFATSFVADPGTARGALPPYAAGALRVEFEDVRLPVPTGPWRGLGAGPNCWATETAIDALARHRGQDPVAFRLANMEAREPRLAAVLRRVAVMSGWNDHRARPEHALGVACGIYKETSYAAAVARVERTSVGYRVTRLWCAHDCGFVVNPDQVRAQVEGNLAWGIGLALTDRLEVEDGRVIGENFFDYVVPRHGDIPDIDVALLDSAAPPSGAGETAMVCGAAAVTNAIAALAGQPVTRLPVRS